MNNRQKSIVTYLEMRSRCQLQPSLRDSEGLLILHSEVKQWQMNKLCYSWIGAQWQWQDKLSWSDAQWQAYVEDETVHTYIACHRGSLAGYFELIYLNDEVQIAIFGLTPAFIGHGFGGMMLTRATEIAWLMRPNRVWLHTCTLDHPAALDNYKARGFRVFKTSVDWAC